jgi:hypothetical protein
VHGQALRSDSTEFVEVAKGLKASGTGVFPTATPPASDNRVNSYLTRRRLVTKQLASQGGSYLIHLWKRNRLELVYFVRNTILALLRS